MGRTETSLLTSDHRLSSTVETNLYIQEYLEQKPLMNVDNGFLKNLIKSCQVSVSSKTSR